MEKWEPLNMEIRSWVISQVLRLEQTSSDLIRTMLRLFNKDSRTLGNKSSALSFKSKVDLLYDFEEIDKTEYNHLIKIMEIRNQFAHNHNAISFESLDQINSDLNKYLLKFEPDDLPAETTREEKLKLIFSKLFKQVAGKLLVCQIEYKSGLQAEAKKYINDKVIDNIESVWKLALEKNKENKIHDPTVFITSSSGSELDSFYYDFRVALAEYSLAEIALAEKENIKAIFKRKVSTEEMLEQINEEE